MVVVPTYGLIEAGGTKFVLGIASGHDVMIATTRVHTTTPDETIAAVVKWFQTQDIALAAVGIAAFGPLDLDPASPTWGHITRTTKPGWDWCDLAGRVGGALDVPVAIDTDVNGAALAEYRWGAGQGQRVSLYLTIGTGIGGGAVIDGKILRGLSHPEMGHLRLPRHPDDRDFAGICPFHGNCLEGLASGPAIKARWGASLSHLPVDHPAHEIIAHYIAHMAVTLQSIFEPGRIIIGGGVMATPGLLARVQSAALTLGKNYFVGRADEVICLPGLGGNAGLLGALALARGIAADD